MNSLNENYEFAFEKLEVWKNSINFTKYLYSVAQMFPNDEKFDLTLQLKRAAISVSSNIAEGSAKKSLKEQAKYTEILAHEFGYINKTQMQNLRNEISHLSRQINAYKNSQLRRYNEK